MRSLAGAGRGTRIARLGWWSLSEKELDDLIGARDHKPLLVPGNELYREPNMAEKTPSRAEAIRHMYKNSNLIERPVVVRGEQIILGLNEAL